MRKIVLFLAISILGFAEEVTTIINEGVSLPKIVVQDASNLEDKNLQTKFNKLVIGDLKVGATFEVDITYNTSSYEGGFDTNIDSAAFIFRYEVSGDMQTSLSLKAKVLDAKSAKIIYEDKFDIDNTEKYPFLVHQAISEIVKNIGYSNVDWMRDPILLSRYTSARTSEILLADYTLSYKKVLINDGLSIFPKWANTDKNAFYYTKYVDKTPILFKFNLGSGFSERVFQGNGMLIASDVSEDGTKILLTNAPNDQPDIYLYNILLGTVKRITTYGGIDVGGNFIDNDTRVAFVSDRLGYPNIFAKNIDGSGKASQVVFHGKNNSSMTTNKSYIAYSSREQGGGFNIYLMSTQSDYIRQLTADGKNLFPRFSTDGGSLMFIKQASGKSAVGIIRINENKSFHFPLNLGKIQSIDW